MSRRGRLAALAAAGVVLLGGLVAWLIEGDRPVEVAPAPPSSAVLAEAPSLAAAPAPVASAPTEPRARREVASAAPPRVEACDLGAASAAEAGRAGRPDRRFPVPPQVSERFASGLKSSSDDALRALGIHLDGRAAAALARQPFQARAAACGGDKACERQALRDSRTAVDAALAPARQELIRLASTTRDPAAYAIAWQQVCQVAIGASLAPRDACPLGLERWAQLDPDNAVPWLYLAFASRRDEAAAAEALFRAAGARTLAHPGRSLLARVAPSLERVPDEADRLRLGFDLSAVEAAWPNPPYATALGLCGAGKVQDANRRQLCDSVASTLVSQAGTLTDHAVGARIGELAGWEADRVAALRLERDALAAALSQRGRPDSTSCADWKREIDRAVRRSQVGQLAYAREAALASGKSMAELAAPAVEARRRRALAASSAAASGVAAPAAPSR